MGGWVLIMAVPGFDEPDPGIWSRCTTEGSPNSMRTGGTFGPAKRRPRWPRRPFQISRRILCRGQPREQSVPATASLTFVSFCEIPGVNPLGGFASWREITPRKFTPGAQTTRSGFARGGWSRIACRQTRGPGPRTGCGRGRDHRRRRARVHARDPVVALLLVVGRGEVHEAVDKHLPADAVRDADHPLDLAVGAEGQHLLRVPLA